MSNYDNAPKISEIDALPIYMDLLALSGLVNAKLVSHEAFEDYKDKLEGFYSDGEILELSVRADNIAFPEGVTK